MRHLFEDEQKKISEFMLENDEICMNDLIGYVVNHLSKYPTMTISKQEFETQNGRKFIVTIEEERLIPVEIEVVK
jgi:hypothetical protein